MYEPIATMGAVELGLRTMKSAIHAVSTEIKNIIVLLENNAKTIGKIKTPNQTASGMFGKIEPKLSNHCCKFVLSNHWLKFIICIFQAQEL